MLAGDIQRLRANQHQWRGQGLPGLEFRALLNDMFAVYDRSGYITMASASMLEELLQIEAKGRGNVRELVTGKSLSEIVAGYEAKRDRLLGRQRVEVSLEDLDLELG